MKRLLFTLALFALLLPASRPAEAEVDVSIDFFYNNLTTGGSWVEVGDYGYCWQPSIAVSNNDWRPYTDGYWAYTDFGWTWVSYEDFGWATYHYGRWARVRGHGWIWVPGRTWGPAWVSWRTGGDYVGWAPLPPRRGYAGGEFVYEGRPISGYVDVDFDIGPAYYNFVNVRYIGEPVLRRRLLSPAENITYVQNTVNVTNITYNNNTVYNYGPDIERLSTYSERPIQRLKVERRPDADFRAAQQGDLTKVQGDTLIVASPAEFKKGAPEGAPKELKTKIEKADLETGWSDVKDESKKQELIAKMKQEDRKSIPPPKVEPQRSPGKQPEPGSLAASPDGTPVRESEPSKKADEAAPDQKKEDDAKNKAKQARPDRKPAAPEATPAEATPADLKEQRRRGRPEKKVEATPEVSEAQPVPVPQTEEEKRAGKKPDLRKLRGAEPAEDAAKKSRAAEPPKADKPVKDEQPPKPDRAQRDAQRQEGAQKVRAEQEARQKQAADAAQEQRNQAKRKVEKAPPPPAAAQVEQPKARPDRAPQAAPPDAKPAAQGKKEKKAEKGEKAEKDEEKKPES